MSFEVEYMCMVVFCIAFSYYQHDTLSKISCYHWITVPGQSSYDAESIKDMKQKGIIVQVLLCVDYSNVFIRIAIRKM